MKKLLLLVSLIPALTFAQTKKQKKAQEKADKETLADIKAHIQYLASDKLEGRRAGSEGEKLAMQYITQQFEKNGLEAKGTAGYIQEFDIDAGKQFDSAGTSMIVDEEKLELKDDFFPLPFSANKTAKGSASLSLRERGAPWFWDVKDVLDDNKQNPHFDISQAIYKEALNTAKRGGNALVVFNSSASIDNILFDKHDSSASVPIPVVYLTKTALKKYFNDVTSIFDINVQVQLNNKKFKAHNVVGYINNNAASTVILGAHYDHVGYGEDGNALDTEKQVHNGADDNASGTAALIELGRIIKKSRAKNNNYLFIAFSGEELGLLGSKYWVQHPSITITPNYMINLDMVGRYDIAKKLIVGGYGTSPAWSSVLTTATDNNLIVKFDSSGGGPSDHASFYREEIPVLYFFTNLHGDYHKTSDDADKINYSGEVDIITYINRVITAADAKGKLAFNKTKDLELKPVTLPVTLGVMPDYSYSGIGLRIDGVSKGKIAEKIGLQQGDVLVQLGDYKFVDILTYMHALEHFRKGDKTKLKIKRGSEEKQFDVEF